MNSISRVISAIHHQPANPIARGELSLDLKFARDFLSWQGNAAAANSPSDTNLLIACCRALKLDLVCIQSEGIANNNADLSAKLTDISRISDEGLFVFWVVNGSFQTAMTRRGMMALLTDIARSPDALDKELWRISDQVTATMAQGVAAGAHGIILADDIAYNQSTYMSPDFVEQVLLPIWRTQTITAGNLGVPVFFHSDGNLNAVLPAIADAGFDGLQCIEPAAGMDLQEIKQAYGKKLCLMGNLDPALLSEQGRQNDSETPFDHLHRAVSAWMASAAGESGFIFGTCSGLHGGMSPELVHYMYQLVSELDPTACAKAT